MDATTITMRLTASSGDRIAQPRRSGRLPVQNESRMTAAQPANALRVTTNARIHVRPGVHAAGSSAANASITTPASPTIE